MNKPDLTRLHAIGARLAPMAQRYRAVLIVLLAGVLLLASGGRGERDASAAAPAVQQGAGFDLASFERALHDKLAAIEGVGRVELMLSLEQTGEDVYAVNTRRTWQDGTGQSEERDLTVVSDGSYGEKPVTVKSLLPVFRGAVVLCDGADDAAVRLAVTQAVGTVCGLGADKVTVLKMAAAS